MKYLYIVDHFEPFPRSKYGGLWNVIADNNEECFDLIVENDGGFGEQYYRNLRQNINNARVFALSEEHNTSYVVESFTT